MLELRKTNIETVLINEYCVKRDSLDTVNQRSTRMRIKFFSDDFVCVEPIVEMSFV